VINDTRIIELLGAGRLRVNLETGHVFSAITGKKLGSTGAKGYLLITINYGRGRGCKKLPAHRVVCIAAHGPPPNPNAQVNHKNGKKQDNRPENLEWVSPSENVRHAVRLGLMPDKRGTAHPNARLTDGDVRMIRAMKRDGARTVDIARCFDLATNHVLRLCNGESWGHLPLEVSHAE
jgi:hypothetical protein